MNTLGIALLWCVAQVTLIALLAGGFYLMLRRLRPAAAATTVLTGLMIVVGLSLLVLSPWPRWTTGRVAPPRSNQARLCATSPSTCRRARRSPGGRRFLSRWQRRSGEPRGVETASSKTLSASLAMLGQSLLAELSTPPTAATTGGPHWPAVAAGCCWRRWPAGSFGSCSA